MKIRKDRRRSPREVLQPPDFGIIDLKNKNIHWSLSGGAHKKTDTLLVDMVNINRMGILVESPLKFRTLSNLDMLIRHPQDKSWKSVTGKVKWLKDSPSRPGYYLFGVEFAGKKRDKISSPQKSKGPRKGLTPDDLEFLLNTKLFHSIPHETLCPLLNSLTHMHRRAGGRLISQGDEGDRLYIIQNGSCIVNFEQNNKLHPVARLKEGDIVGEMAVLTGERRSAHVDAETDMDLWSLKRTQFDALSREYTGLRSFLTEIVTNRFSTSKMTSSRTVGKYVIKEVIGQGGWSIVYKGIHGKLNLPVAIKMLKHNMAMDPEFLEKFQNEAKTIARLNHPNVISIYDIEELYRTVFIIMEYLNGVSLEYLLEHMPKLSLSGILDILLQVCAGLAYAHQQGIIHQDIKPANIFIQPDGLAKIVDFGLACPPGNIDFDMPGTVFYMAPEQIEGRPVDEKTDIYALGITAYEMITGRRPFPEDDLGKLMDLHIQEDIPDPRIHAPGLPDELYHFVMKSSRKDPSERYRNISQVISELAPLAGKIGVKACTHKREAEKMIGLFLFYEGEKQPHLNRLIDDFQNAVAEVGAVLRVAQVEDL